MHLGEPQGKEGNQKIRDKCKQYLDRAEELQHHLDKKEVTIKLSLSLCVFMNMSKQFGPQWTESLFEKRSNSNKVQVQVKDIYSS